MNKLITVSLTIDAQLSASGAKINLVELHDLLHLVDRHSSIREAVAGMQAQANLKLNYRSVWGRLEHYHRVLGRPLVIKRQGQGSALSTFGKALLIKLDEQLIAPAGLDQTAAKLANAIEQLVSGRASAALRLSASHDPELVAIAQTMQDHFLLQTTGSQAAVSALLSDKADIAGFHAVGDQATALHRFGFTAKQLPKYWVRAVILREQGLMVLKGNPKKVDSLRDLSKRSVQFINRQWLSGTRQLLDQMLADAGLQGAAIRGYEDEEFTHRAVAAIVASGKADVGLGLAAAAHQFKLEFIPLAQEVYYLAGRSDTEHLAPVATLLQRFEQVGAKTKGYRSAK